MKSLMFSVTPESLALMHSMAAQPRLQATWGKRREKMASGSVSSFRKPREMLTPQAPEPIVSALKTVAGKRERPCSQFN